MDLFISLCKNLVSFVVHFPFERNGKIKSFTYVVLSILKADRFLCEKNIKTISPRAEETESWRFD